MQAAVIVIRTETNAAQYENDKADCILTIVGSARVPPIWATINPKVQALCVGELVLMRSARQIDVPGDIITGCRADFPPAIRHPIAGCPLAEPWRQ
jgi:hypothetical protein